MEISVISLGSGSKGNCHVLTDGKTSVLIDAGLGYKTTKDKLEEAGVTDADIKGVLLTHEHADHVKSLSYLSERYAIYSHEDTLRCVSSCMLGIVGKNLRAVESPFEVGTLRITPFTVSHDAVHPFGFIVENDESKVGYLTDTGYIGKGMLQTLKGCDAVILESNHDKELLLRGNYPPQLKKRILSDKGHLCNEESALAVRDLAVGGTKRFLLAHISENNNLNELAYWTARKTLESKGIMDGITLKVAFQRRTVVL